MSPASTATCCRRRSAVYPNPVATSVSASEAGVPTCSGTPSRVAPSPAAARNTTPVAGWTTMPAIGSHEVGSAGPRTTPMLTPYSALP